MARPKNLRPTKIFRVTLDAKLVEEIDEEIAMIDLRAVVLPGKRTPYGSRRQIVEPLLRKWLEERKEKRDVPQKERSPEEG